MMADDQVAVSIEPTELTEDDQESGMRKYGLKPREGKGRKKKTK